ncbi:LamG-like jellyroll fold domain-containing protein [Rubritalea marina]|uniref:LamG-like jellyroll fold domain-containing protein n=1 Tax=Rubritalea marina TaxID=361055 RepID=UPI0003733B62|nr:LamG-like jellyroll fold domain-containing protein [Rubritalea marina]
MDERYQVKHLLEEISYGKYFLAEDTFIQRDVQVFYYNAPAVDGWEEIFSASSADLATVSHPGLPIVYNHGVDEDGPYTLRQYVNSSTLNAHLAEYGALGEYEGWELAQQMLEIHDAAKESGSFHGALDPDSINLTTRPSGKKLYVIADYGIADIYRRISGEQAYLGAPYLIAPEQAGGAAASEQSQVYAIGQLVYHALTGGHPWLEASADEVLELQQSQPLPLVSEYKPELPEAFVLWLNAMISTDPAHRYKTFAEASQALPHPVQSAPIPISTTSAVANSPAVAVTGMQGVAPAGVDSGAQGVSAAEAFAAQQEEMRKVKQEELAQKAALFKQPAVLGGIGVVVLGIIGFAVFGGGDDTPKVSSQVANMSQQTKNELSVLPEQGLVAYINFTNDSLKSLNNPDLVLEPILKEPRFSRDGRSGEGLFLSKQYSFKLDMEKAGMDLDRSDYTVSFWIKPSSARDTELSVSSQSEWSGSTTGNPREWAPENAVVAGKSWNMVTIVQEAENEQVTIYLDGKQIEQNSSAGLNDFSTDPYIYLGNYKNESGSGMPPSVIDNFAVWDRPLSSTEIETLAQN